MDTENRWWVAELLAADCEKAWIHPGKEETMQKFYVWLEKMKKEHGKRKIEEFHHKMVNQMIKTHSMATRSADPEERRRRCQAAGPL